MLCSWCYLFCMHVQVHMCGWMHVETRGQPQVLFLRIHSPCSRYQLRHVFCLGTWFHMKIIYRVNVYSKRRGGYYLQWHYYWWIPHAPVDGFSCMSMAGGGEFLDKHSGSQSKKTCKWDGDWMGGWEDGRMVEVRRKREGRGRDVAMKLCMKWSENTVIKSIGL